MDDRHESAMIEHARIWWHLVDGLPYCNQDVQPLIDSYASPVKYCWKCNRRVRNADVEAAKASDGMACTPLREWARRDPALQAMIAESNARIDALYVAHRAKWVPRWKWQRNLNLVWTGVCVGGLIAMAAMGSWGIVAIWAVAAIVSGWTTARCHRELTKTRQFRP